MNPAFRPVTLAAAVALFGCESAIDLSTDDAPGSALDLGAILEGRAQPQAVSDVPVDVEVDEIVREPVFEEIGEDVEPSPVGWTLSEAAVRNYAVWQQHLKAEHELASLAESALDTGTLDGPLKVQAQRLLNREPPASSLGRFGLTLDEAAGLEQLLHAAHAVRAEVPHSALESAARSGTARRFVEDLRSHRARTLRDATEALRQEFGDENVELLLKYEHELPLEPIEAQAPIPSPPVAANSR